MVSLFSEFGSIIFWPKTLDYNKAVCKGDDLYPPRLLHQNYRCYRGQNVAVSRCY